MFDKSAIGIVVVLATCALCCGNRCSRDTSEPQETKTPRQTSHAGEFAGASAAEGSGSHSESASDAGRGAPRSTRVIRGVNDGSAPATRKPTSIDDRLLGGNSSFAFRLVKKTCGSGEPKNLFISPLSVSAALAMTYNGASAKTADEMADVLGFKGISLDELNRSMADLTAALADADSAVRLTVANSLWGRKGFAFRPDFLKRNAAYYRAKASILDFSDPGAPGVINDWVKDATRGLIPGIVDAISPETMLYLINAIYFKGSWQVAFDPATTSDGAFHLAGGSEKTVPMMNRSGSFKYADDASLQVIRLPYGSGRMGMYVFLPKTADGLSAFVAALDDRAFVEWVSRLAMRDGDVVLPRFKMIYECGLADALKAMGMKEAFDTSAADFSGMSDAHLFISAVKHKAVVDVNEEGTEAAAVTSVEMSVTSVGEPKNRFSFVADRPFFFIIRDEGTGSIVFMGALYDPSA